MSQLGLDVKLYREIIFRPRTFDLPSRSFAHGTSQQNRDYICKEGKWSKDKKKETNLQETFEEDGEMPIERKGARFEEVVVFKEIRSASLDTHPSYKTRNFYFLLNTFKDNYVPIFQ